MRDRQITILYRSAGLSLLVGSGFFLSLSHAPQKWLSLLLIWLAFAVTFAVHTYGRFRNIETHFHQVLQRTKGTLKKGNYFFSVPPSLSFQYQGRNCHIGHSIDPKFDPLIEYLCQTDKEVELRINRRTRGGEGGHFVGRFTAEGADKDLIDRLLRESQNRAILEKLMRDFSHLYFGKDGRVKLIERYDSSLTEPQKIFSTFENLITLIQYVEAKF